MLFVLASDKKPGGKVGVGGIILILIPILTIIGYGIATPIIEKASYEKALVLKKEIAKNECNIILDHTWKLVQIQLNVSDTYKESFKVVYIKHMNDRYSGSNIDDLRNWIISVNPTCDDTLYKIAINTIEGSRSEYTFASYNH
jgi:hypothetical protein